MEIALVILIPFIGTILGSAVVYLLKDKINEKAQKILIGFASGVMLAASIWSLLIPSIESSSNMGKLSFIPAVVGFLLGVGFLLLLDTIIPHIHIDNHHHHIQLFLDCHHYIPLFHRYYSPLLRCLFHNQCLFLS